MNCDQTQEKMIDVLYGEEVSPRLAFEFFQHLAGCSQCNGEYLDLVQTRERLTGWEIDHTASDTLPHDEIRPTLVRLMRKIPWTSAPRIAAVFLMVVGLVSILQYMGYAGGRRLVVSEPQLTELVRDMVVAEQAQERRLMLEAMLHVKEDVEIQQRANAEALQQHLMSLEERYVENMERNNHYLQRLLSR